jgi:hypothetical protein
MTKLFISHSTHDKAFVRDLRAVLAEEKYILNLRLGQYPSPHFK